jgi:two-component system sensor histidine kinase and response regulator WspE
MAIAPHAMPSNEIAVVLISDRTSSYGLVVDQFLGEKELVVRPLDPRLGKVPNISAAALMEDGTPTLIVDVEDLVRSIDKLLNGNSLTHIAYDDQLVAQKKRILVVDDSLTVREVERKLLENQGYEVAVAIDGMDGWNILQTNENSFNLVIADVDMPRMNGLELVSRIRSHPILKSLPVVIVSYKDREEDRLRGLEVGADFYLTKSSFHDNSLVQAVQDLIGTP